MDTNLETIDLTQAIVRRSIEIYVFGTPSQARAAGFTGPSLAHPKHPDLRAVCLQNGEQLFDVLRGAMVSRIVVTDGARRAAHNLPYAGMLLDKLRHNAPVYLRAPPGIYLEL